MATFYTNPNDTVQFNESTFRSYVLSQEEYKKQIFIKRIWLIGKKTAMHT